METFKFNNILQKGSQTIDNYVTELRQQQVCDFKCTKCGTSFEDRMIKDRLIFGINDKQVVE